MAPAWYWLAITAARDVATQSGGVDANKRLMIVADCHVTQLLTRPYTLATGAVVQGVSGIDTSAGLLDLSGPILSVGFNGKPCE